MDSLKKDMQNYANKFNVPIIEDDGLQAVSNIIKQHNIKSIIEIGSAIGYSAICMSEVNGCRIDTIERDEQMYQEVLKNVKLAQLEHKISPHFGDALVDEFVLPKDVDMLYIDAAKSQYRRFFLKYCDHVKLGGIIVFDNLKFHGYVDMELSEIKSRNLRQLIRKLKEFNNYVCNIEGYSYEFIDVGDGIGILTKECNE